MNFLFKAHFWFSLVYSVKHCKIIHILSIKDRGAVATANQEQKLYQKCVYPVIEEYACFTVE
jgi:hypothetical protein